MGRSPASPSTTSTPSSVSFLRDDRPSLLVSLPTNSVELAEAAVAGGADGLKVHLHVSHRVSRVTFGDLEEERAALEPIAALDVPLGLVVGPNATSDEFAAARALGVTFFDIFLADAPDDFVRSAAPAAAMVAVTGDTAPSAIAGVADAGVAAVEAALAHPDDYGTEPTAAWRDALAGVVDSAGVPVVVPTQHHLDPAHLDDLVDIGIGAILLGAVVTGTTPATIEATTRRFRNRIDELASG